MLTNGETEQAPIKEKLQNNKVAIATTTFYKNWSSSYTNLPMDTDQLRGDLAIETIKLAKNKGFQLTIIDGGSSLEFKEALNALDVQFIEQKEKGMSASRRQAFQEAMILPNADVICWTEPEKISMIENLEELAKPILEDGVDIVIPTRTVDSYETYPEQQARSEQKANHLFSKVLRLIRLLPKNSSDLDTFFGPRLFRNDPEVVQLFTRQYELKENSRLNMKVKPDNYLNSTFFPIILALEKGLRVRNVSIDYHHPKKQTDFEKGKPEFEKKRIGQKQDIVSGAIQLARLLINNSKKPSELLINNT